MLVLFLFVLVVVFFFTRSTPYSNPLLLIFGCCCLLSRFFCFFRALCPASSTFRHDLKIRTSDEGRVMNTAAAFAKGFLELEGELTPILVSLVSKEKDENQSGGEMMLDHTGNKDIKKDMDRWCVDVYSFPFFTLLLSSFWTSRGHRRRPFPPPPRLLPSMFIAHRVQQSRWPSIFH